MVTEDKTRVARRRVFYIPGYDPYPPRRYRELYRTESQRQAEISGYRIDQNSDVGETGWTVHAEIDGGRTQTKIDALVWNDLVQHSMDVSIAATYGALVKTTWIYLSTGTLRRLSWLAKGPVLAALYPVVMLLGQVLLAGGLGAVLGRLVASFVGQGAARLGGVLGVELSVEAMPLSFAGGVVFWLVFLLTTLFVLRWFKSHDHRTFAYYLMQDYAYTASERGAYPQDIEARLEVFRQRVTAAMQDDVDEVLIVGHSSGAQLAVSLVADVVRSQLSRPDRPVLSLLTLGQVIPMLSFLPEAHRLRADLRFLSVCESITWLDVSAPGDGCSFALSEPVAVSGVAPDAGQLWPLVISAAFTNTLAPETLAKLKYRYFRLHFQYLCAFDRPGDYDYFKITAGPRTLGQRFAGRQPSKSRVDVPASRFTSVLAAGE